MFKSPGQASFDKLLEKATSNLLLEPDWASIMQICDLIRQKDCQPKYAVVAIKKKLYHTNPHVVLFGLLVLESVVKNCGSPVQEEVATKVFMEELRELTKATQHENVRDKVLELVQAWAHAFRKLPSFRAVQDVVNIMKAEGMKFPPMSEADAMFKADSAPEWADGGCCHRCRSEFGIMNRKHHCRACGQIFCAKCSSRTATLPNFGIEKEVRVCESCYEKHGRGSRNNSQNPGQKSSEDILNEVIAASLAEAKAKQSQPPKGKTEEELAEEEQLQLAIAISQSEAEAKERDSRGGGRVGSQSAITHSSAPADKVSPNKGATNSGAKSGNFESEDPELARYLDRTYWDQRQQKQEDKKEETGAKAPVAAATTVKQASTSHNHGQTFTTMAFQPSAPVKENKDKGEQVEEIDNFVDSLRGQIEMFVNRMKSNSSRGRLISYDSSVQSLFLNITALHSQLLNYIQDQDNWRSYYEGLQDKLSQVKDARDALDALRKEHFDHLKQLAEEAERQRQFQMAQKLQVMRQKKHEYLQYQRQLALQRVQEQERQMQMRIEHQRAISAIVPPGGYGAYGPPPQGYMQNPVQGGPGMPSDNQMHYMQQQGGPQPGQFMGQPNMPPGGIPPQQNPMVGQQQGPQMGHYPQPGQFMPMQIPPQQQGPGPQGQMQQGPPPTQSPGQQQQGPPQQQPQMQMQQGPLQQPPQHQPQMQMQQGPPQQPPQQIQHFYAPQPPPPQQQPHLALPEVPNGNEPKPEPSTAELISFD